mgnify:CR=1 FL=1
MPLCNRRICIIGPRGVGKSHAVRKILPELHNCKHVIGSDLLKAELRRHGLESMEGLDDVTKDVIRQFASEEMVRQASAGCDIFICEGHAALLPARSLSRLEKAWRQVQVWLGKRESVFDVSVGFTELDKAFFNEVILVEADDEVIQERRVADQDKRRPTDLDSIRADIEAERATQLGYPARSVIIGARRSDESSGECASIPSAARATPAGVGSRKSDCIT